MNITNASRLPAVITARPLNGAKSKYLHRQNINVPESAHAMRYCRPNEYGRISANKHHTRLYINITKKSRLPAVITASTLNGAKSAYLHKQNISVPVPAHAMR